MYIYIYMCVCVYSYVAMLNCSNSGYKKTLAIEAFPKEVEGQWFLLKVTTNEHCVSLGSQTCC